MPSSRGSETWLAPIGFSGSSPGPPARTSGGCARGAPGQAGGPGADRRGEEAAKKRPGLGTAVTPRREIPVKEPPGLARGAGCWPRRSRAVAPSPADAGAARVSGRKRPSPGPRKVPGRPAVSTLSRISSLSPCWDESRFESRSPSSCQHPSSHSCPVACFEPLLNHPTQTGYKYLLC